MRNVTKLLQMLTAFMLMAFVFATQGNAQSTLLTESWENGGSIPAGWATEQVSGTAGVIYFTNTSAHPTGITAFDGSYFVRFNSWSASNGNSTRVKRTTPISTVGYTNVAIDFAWYENTNYSGNADRVIVQWSTNGTSWTDAATYNRYNAVQGWKIKNVPLPAGAAGQATLYIAYTFVSEYGDDCHLDLTHVTAIGPPAPVTVTIGSGTSTTSYPYLTFWHDGRTQLLYTAAEILAAGGSPGSISTIGFDVSSYSSQVMNGFNIRFQSTTATTLTSFVTSGWTTAYTGTYAVPGTGWQMITLQTPFIWDGNNLLVEICYDNTSYTSYSYVRGTSASQKAVYYYTDGAAGCSFTSAYTGSVRPNLRFVVLPYVGTLNGTVTSAFNGSPIAGANIVCGTKNTTTNASGQYTIYNVPIGNYSVQASATGFVSQSKPGAIVNQQTTTIDFSLEPIPGVLTGVVTNVANGNPVVGAKLVANNPPYNTTAYSTAGGAYTLNVYPVGNFGVTCSKTGFDNLSAGPFAFVQGTTLNQNFALLENLNAPVNVTAALNAGETAVDINWGLPVGNYELLYDDGIGENFTVWAVGGNLNAVKYTPVAYPATVYGGKVNIGTINNYPSGSNPLVPFKIAVYNVAANGMPGTALDSTDVTPTGFGWVEFTLNTPITVTSGSFFLVMIQGGNFPDAAGILIDETNTQLRSYARFVTGGGPWIPASGNFMMRALINGAGGPLLLDGSGMTITGNANPAAMYDHMPVTVTGVEGVGSIIPLNGDNTDQITGYQVWRLKQGEEGTPGLWTSIGTPASTSIVDNGWPSLPCGPYRWAVKAQYTGNRWSTDAFSNVLGKCWVADITVNVTLTCAAHEEEGTFVKLQNNAYPDSVYIAATDTNGQVIFDNVWKGNYTLTAWRFNYTTHTQVIDITGDATIDVMLLQDKTPPTNLFVDDRSLDAVWNAPRAAVLMFNEAWTSGSFATNQWTTSGGSNWMMTTGLGNPAPSAMFSWSPQVTNYNQYLTSKQFTGLYSPQQLLKYDIYLDNFDLTYENTMAIEIWDGATWTVLKTWTNMNGSISWTTDVLDISAYNDINFRIRFHAAGEDSYDLNNWNIDNISIIATDGTTGNNPCVLGYNFYLNNVLSAFVMDTVYAIPANQVQYGTTYNACVSAVYGSGYSTQSCYSFTSHFLYPPLNLEVEAVECSAYLTWEQPATLDLVRVPAYKGTVEHTAANTGLAPMSPDMVKSAGVNRNTDGTIIFGFEAFADGTVDFDVDNVSAFTLIGGNTASDFINGMVFLPGQPDDAYAVAYGGGNLYSINHATGTMTVVGYLGSNSFHDLAVDPGTGIIYGTTLTALYTIDPTVPSATLVGNHGAATTMIAIGCDGSGDLYGYDITTDMWYSIDKTTGAATQIGSIGFNSSYAQGMFYDQPTGNLMMAAYNAGNSQTEIRAVDVTTGASVILSNGSGMEITGASYPITSGGGGQVPDGLIGYNVYRDGIFIAFVSGADTTWYYDLNLDPDNYEYAVTAKYDLTDYGFPGQFDESIIEGPETVSILCGRPLPFYEPWDQATFAYNDWTFGPSQGNWTINTGLGNPAPTADFSWQPMVTDYSYALESPILNAGSWTCAALWFDFDYKLVDRNATGDELLSVEVYYNGSWHQKVEFANNGSVDWTPQHIDISAAQGKALKVRFVAYGANSADILHWYVDNVHVYGICNSPVDLDYAQSQFTTTLTWTAPECTGGGASTPIDFIFDDGSAENGWAINPGYLAWLGNEFPIAPTYEGVLQSFDVWFGFNPSTSMLLTLDVYDGAQNLVGSSDPFTAPYEDWLTVNVNDIPFSGLFYGMVKWNNLSGATNYMGFDEDGPYATDNLGWYYDGSTWEKISIAGGGNPGVFLVRAHALVGGDLKEVTLVPSRQSNGVITNSPAITGIDGYFDTKNYGTLGVSDNLSDSSQIIGYNVFRTDESGTGPFSKLNGAPVAATTYVDTYPPTLVTGSFQYYVTAVYNDSQTGTFLCESPSSDTIDVTFPAVGINELGKGAVQIYPNPASEVVNVKSDATIAGIEVMNFVGQTVYNVQNVGAKTTKINVTSLTSGVYFVKVTTEQGIRTAKITVTH